MKILDNRDTETQPWTREEDTALLFLLRLGHKPWDVAALLRRDHQELIRHYMSMKPTNPGF